MFRPGLVRVLAFFSLVLVDSTRAQADPAQWINYTQGRFISGIGSHAGLIWAGTDGGLVRIESNTGQTTFFNRANSPLLSGNDLGPTYVTPSGTVWCSVNGANSFDGSTWAVYRTDNSGLPSNYVKCYAAGPDGSMWMGSAGITHFDGQTWTRTRPSQYGLVFNSVNCIAVSPTGVVWAGVPDGYVNNVLVGGGLMRFDGTQWSVFTRSNSGLLSHQIQALAVAPDGAVWLGAHGYWDGSGWRPGGVSRFDGLNWTHFHPSNSNLPSEDVRSVAVGEDGIVWAATDQGVAYCKSGVWTVLDAANSGLPTNDVAVIHVADDGSVLVGTNGYGLFRLQAAGWELLNTSNSGIPTPIDCEGGQPWIEAFAQDTGGAIWMGITTCLTGALLKYQHGEWTQIATDRLGVPQQKVFDVAFDAAGGLWLAVVGRSVMHWDGNTWTEYDHTNSGLETTSPASLAIEPNGTVWVGSRQGGPPAGVYRLNASGWTHWYLPSVGLGTVYDIALDRDGMPWVGTSRGPGRFTGSTWVPFAWTNVNDTPALLKDRNGDMWVGTDEFGLGKWDGTSWTVYTTANSGLPSNNVTSLAQGPDGALWIGTVLGGLARFDGITWTVFNTQNSGIAGDYWISSVFIDRLGNAWVCADGLSVYNAGGVQTGLDDGAFMPRTRLLANVPNPFNPSTTVRFELASPQVARLTVHDVRGRLVRVLSSQLQTAGAHGATWDGRNGAGAAVQSGVYLVRLSTPNAQLARKIVLVR